MGVVGVGVGVGGGGRRGGSLRRAGVSLGEGKVRN